MRRASCVRDDTELVIANRQSYITIWASGHIEHTMPKERSSRSNSYQWKILEISADHDTLALNPADTAVDEASKELQDAATARVLALLDKVGTPKQKLAAQLIFSGLTQSETSLAMGGQKGNSTIHKTLKGNTLYQNGNASKVRQGGIAKKLLVAMLKDGKLKLILQELHEQTYQGKVYHLMWSQFGKEQDFVEWMQDVPYSMLPENRERKNEYNLKYRKSAKGKAAQARYRHSAKGRAMHLRRQLRRQKTPKYKQKRKKWDKAYQIRNRDKLLAKKRIYNEKKRQERLSEKSAANGTS